MDRFLLKLEVSRKQDYIFRSKQLRNNAARSAEIDFVTGHLTGQQDFFQEAAEDLYDRAKKQRDFFQEVAGDLYDRAKNLVYAGGGHAVLQFDSEANADRFARRVTRAAMERFPGMELFVKRLHYDENRTGAENLRALSRALEEKKALRRNAVGQVSFGVEKLDRHTYQPQPMEERHPEKLGEAVPPPKGCEYPKDFRYLCGADNFLAVVHIDGNSMGTRVNGIYDQPEENGWDGLRQKLKRFSDEVDAAFKDAFWETAERIAAYLDKKPHSLNHEPPKQGTDLPPENALPIRPIILAGDDVCFVTMGSIALESARIFLEALARHAANSVDGKSYSACAGVALVHRKYPFHEAYQLAEALCASAKTFGVQLLQTKEDRQKNPQEPKERVKKDEKRVSAMDWHIDFGQLKDGLEDQRRDYRTEDGNRLELRPVTVCTDGVSLDERWKPRSYQFFRAMCLALQSDQTARGKIKGARPALKQGEVETAYFLRMKQAESLLDHSLSALYATPEEKRALYYRIYHKDAPARLPAFADTDGSAVKRSLLFDAIEMMDHFIPLDGEEKETET